MCNACVRVMRREGGAALFLCAVCHHKCEPIHSAPKKKKKSFLGFLQDAVGIKPGNSAR
jgi:hypothetical protein